MKRLVCAVALAVVGAPVAASVQIPKDLHGIWDTDAAACADDEMVNGVKISADSLTFYESTITPLRLTKEAAGQYVIVGDWEEYDHHVRLSLRIKLAPDDNRLSISYDGGKPDNFVRCEPRADTTNIFLQIRKTTNA